ncbi:preprotein translocase subunit YajC [Janibacter sp. G349]|jgi:preprotein translocase subunit YajC|uniref:preprotein translocase subunit YajC n=1 Tax=unclassified Janibacter TaxID=2649294 RepID=UPI0020CCC30E|nr:preprotein translocase subunit YajC [Janibacter sp. CX7]UTT67517.1 preprotein translocase subunit YajC [Janibacter sp. CX7]
MNQGSQTASLILLILPLILIGFMLWSARRRQKTMADFSASLQVGEEVVTTSGIFGRITEVEDDRVRLEAAPGIVLTLDRRAIGAKVAPGGDVTTDTDGRD